jgi:hypothetical protein
MPRLVRVDGRAAALTRFHGNLAIRQTGLSHLESLASQSLGKPIAARHFRSPLSNDSVPELSTAALPKAVKFRRSEEANQLVEIPGDRCLAA